LGGRVAVAVAAAVASPPWGAVGATVSAAAPVGDATAAAGGVGVTDVEPDAQADRTAIESTMLRRKETTFDNPNLALFILLSFVYQADVTA
jgi:hypothetical protein